MVTAYIILIVFIFLLWGVGRTRQEHVTTDSLEETQNRSKWSMIRRIIYFGISLYILIKAIQMLHDSSIIVYIFGFVYLIIGIVFSVITVISLLKSIGRYIGYKDMTDDEYRIHQEGTKQAIKEDDEATAKAFKNYRRARGISKIINYLWG